MRPDRAVARAVRARERNRVLLAHALQGRDYLDVPVRDPARVQVAQRTEQLANDP